MQTLLYCIFVLLMILALFYVEIKRAKKISFGLEKELEKSEKRRINLEELKNKILLMIDDLPEGLLIINSDGRVSVINKKAEKFLGVDRKQVLNRPVFDLGNLSSMKKIVFPVLVNFRGTHRQEIEVRKNFILDLTIEPMVLGKYNIAKLIILHDITKDKYAESAKNQFISVAAHQLKSPLSSINLSLKMLVNNDFGRVSKKQKEILEKTCKQNESLIYLVEYLLKEAKIEKYDHINNKSEVNLEDLIVSVADFYKNEIKRKKIIFKFNKPARDLPKVFADPEKIKMVIQNLFDNAVKYTPEKGRIEINLSPLKEDLEFAIKDNGIGIPEDQKSKIFKRFSRVANAAGVQPGGSGLGLSIAKDVIEKHRGKIWFQSKEDKGSTFYFSLPFIKE